MFSIYIAILKKHIIKSGRFILVILIILYSNILANNWKIIKPDKKSKVFDVKGSKYYLFDNVQIKISGPCKLKINTRFINPKVKKYKILVIKDNKKYKIISLKPGIFFDFNSTIKIGENKSFKIKVPIGDHIYKFKILKKEKCLFQFLKKELDWQRIAPISKNKSTILIEKEEKEKKFTYYILKDYIKLKIQGPTILKILTRLDYSLDKHENQTYCITIFENGKEKKKKFYTTVKSHLSVYKDRPDIIPSVANVEFFKIPKGKHIYEIKLLEPKQITISFNILYKKLKKKKYYD